MQAFSSEEEYGALLRARLRSGSRVVAVAGDHEAGIGSFIRFNGNRQCQVRWEACGSCSWVEWRDIELEVRSCRSALPCSQTHAPKLAPPLTQQSVLTVSLFTA